MYLPPYILIGRNDSLWVLNQDAAVILYSLWGAKLFDF